MIKF